MAPVGFELDSYLGLLRSTWTHLDQLVSPSWCCPPKIALDTWSVPSSEAGGRGATAPRSPDS